MAMFTSNAPAAKFARLGDSVAGEIVDVYRSQRYEYVRGGQGLPLYWQDRKPVAGARVNRETGAPNDPVLQYVITVDTGTPDDNGDTERRIFLKNKRMETALTAAVTLAGGRRVGGLLLGGHLRCTWVGEEQGDGPQPAKVYAFEYAAPPAGTGREPSGEVRLAERDETVQGAVAAFDRGEKGVTARPAPSTPAGHLLPEYRGELLAPPSREALATARQGVRDTDVSTGAGGRPRPADDDEPPF